MHKRRWPCVLIGLFAAIPTLAQNGPLGFENLIDSTIVTTQYAGVTFANTIVLGAGFTLDEFEFPAHGGGNVASDIGGPVTLSFLAPIRSFAGYFTYSVPLTVQALDSGNKLLTSTMSEFSSNQALSGSPGSHPNEFLTVSAPTGIFKIVITGSPQGTSFTFDDAAMVNACDLDSDGYTNATDVQAAINQTLGKSTPVSDLNGDGAITVLDLQIVVNAALAEGCRAK